MSWRQDSGFLSRRLFYMPLDHSCTVLFLARLFAVDIYKDGGLSSFFISPYLPSHILDTRNNSGRCVITLSLNMRVDL